MVKGKSASIRPYKGKPTIFIDEQPYAPQIYALTHVYGGRWSWEEVPARNLKNFADIGFRLFQVDLWFEDIWPENEDQLDLTRAQKQVDGVLQACPEANVFIRLHINPPYWWLRQHPEEAVQYADGPVEDLPYGPPFNLEDGDNDRSFRVSLASEKWKEIAGEKLIEFCQRFSEMEQAASVVGVHIACGIYGEWHYWGFIKHDPDCGKAMTRKFHAWLVEKYKTDANLHNAWNNTKWTLDTATIPDSAERNFTADGIFRVGEEERRVIDYFACQQEVVVEDIEFFSALAKRHWPRSLIVGVFYGYFHMSFSRQATGGHLLTARMLDCPTVDYLAAPQSYWEESRELGGSGHSRAIIDSVLMHGKLWIDEVDNGYLQDLKVIDFVRSGRLGDPRYKAILQRSVLYPLMRNAGFWYYDFGPHRSSGWWDSPVYLNAIRGIKKLGDRLLQENISSAADVLYVWDDQVFYYIKNGWSPVSEDQIDQALEETLHSGAVGDHIYFFDLKRIDLRSYRVIVFMNTYVMSQNERDFVRDIVAGDQRTLLWNYLPGYSNGRHNSFDDVANLTGMRKKPLEMKQAPTVVISESGFTYGFKDAVLPMAVIDDPAVETLGKLAENGQTVVGRRRFRDYVSVYSTLPLHGSDVFRSIYREAGCHIYNDENDFTYANSAMLMVHSAKGGKRTLRLRNGKSVSVTLEPASTVLFDAETGVPL